MIGGILAGAQVGLGLLGHASSRSQARDMMRRQEEAEERNRRLAIKENTRMKGEAERIAKEQISDRIRQANWELGRLNTAAMEAGLAGSSIRGLVRQAAYSEGTDISRIKKNLEEQKASLDAKTEAHVLGSLERETMMQHKVNAQNRQGLFNWMGSSLRIGADYFADKAALKAAQNQA